jgi:hypothetical protein
VNKKQTVRSHTIVQSRFPVTPWERWLSNSSYTPAIRSYIESQAEVFRDLITQHCYENIIELGCGDGTLLMPTVISLHSNYLGIDISTRALSKAMTNLENAKAIHSYSEDARLMVADVCSFSSLRLDRFVKSNKTLVALPFNLIGIISCVESLVRDLHSAGFDILIFSYNMSVGASRARAEYYEKCGFTDIKREKVHGIGILFTDQQELQSYAYYPTTVRKLLKETGFRRVKTIRFNDIGIAYYCTHKT